MIKLESPGAFVDEFFFGIDCYNVGNKHIVAAQRTDIDHLAFDVEWTFGNQGCFDNLATSGGEVHLVKLVVLLSASNPAPVGCFRKFLGGEIDDELACAFDYLV